MRLHSPKRLIATALATLTMVSFAIGTSSTSSAATGDESHAWSRFIGGTVIGGIDTGVAGFLNGVRSDYVEQNPAQAADEKTGPLEIGALAGLLGANFGNVSLPFTDVVQVGAANQYSYAGPNGISRASSGAISDQGVIDTTVLAQYPSSASIDLMKIMPATPLLSQANFSLGAVVGEA
ncbi:MAG: choice-of-anchor G family protein, partial [Propionibacteriaceae bacterium]|nr:choice-of-anchor G family protein [Propionibacteriaceae bacterium]